MKRSINKLHQNVYLIQVKIRVISVILLILHRMQI